MRPEPKLVASGGTLTASASGSGAYKVVMADSRFAWTDIPLGQVCAKLYVPLGAPVASADDLNEATR